MSRALMILVVLMSASGCATRLDGPRYADQTPRFDLFGFFDGTVDAWGIVQNRSGEVVQRFTVEIEGRRTDGRLILDEAFTYALGEGVERRVWTIEREADGTYAGSAGDILATAAGEANGNAFRWAYAMDLPVGGRSYRVRFEDWIFALDAQRIINRSYIQKFGLDVAEVTIFMQRRGRGSAGAGG
jgi:hypothetical protein